MMMPTVGLMGSLAERPPLVVAHLGGFGANEGLELWFCHKLEGLLMGRIPIPN